MTFPARVAAKAAEVQPARGLLTVLAFPFYVLGLLVGLVIAFVLWAYAAAAVGVADVRERSRRVGPVNAGDDVAS